MNHGDSVAKELPHHFDSVLKASTVATRPQELSQSSTAAALPSSATPAPHTIKRRATRHADIERQLHGHSRAFPDVYKLRHYPSLSDQSSYLEAVGAFDFSSEEIAQEEPFAHRVIFISKENRSLTVISNRVLTRDGPMPPTAGTRIIDKVAEIECGAALNGAERKRVLILFPKFP